VANLITWKYFLFVRSSCNSWLSH